MGCKRLDKINDNADSYNPELGDNPWENPETIYLEVSLQELFLEESNPKWSEDKFILSEWLSR